MMKQNYLFIDDIILHIEKPANTPNSINSKWI